MSALVVRGDSLRLPLRDASVDLIVCSPPYFSLRSYRDGGEHFEGQIGSEPHPRDYLEALWSVMAECWRVLKPTGSCFVNLGDKRSGSGGHNNSGISRHGMNGSTLYGAGRPDIARRQALQEQIKAETARGIAESAPYKASRRDAPDRYTQAAFGRPKSKMLLPHRFAIGCEDGLADPEGIGWVVRQDIVWSKLNGLPESVTDRCRDSHEFVFHLTKQGSYFSAVDELRDERGRDPRPNELHTPSSTGCDPRHTQRWSGRSESNPLGKLPSSVWPLASEPLLIPDAVKDHYGLPDHFAAFPTELVRRIILGWSPSGGTVLDVFGGTGTTAMVARALGRRGYSVDLSADYCRLASWRIFRSGHGAKAIRRTNAEAQEVMAL